MADPVELKALVKKLQAATTDPERIDLLKTLQKEAKITEALLRESKAGLAVGKLRQNPNEKIAALAKQLVNAWKAQVQKDKAHRGDSSTSKDAGRKSSTPAPATPVTPTAKFTPNGPTRTAKSDGIKFDGITGDKTRDKCIEILYDALAVDSGSPSDLIEKRANALELAVLEAHGGSSSSGTYKSRIRTLMVNLKDKSNPGLRESIVSGDLSTSELATMSTEDMASEERKAQNQEIQKQNLFNSLAAGEQEAETDAFKCGRCKQRKCRYRQQQTRSADEPMTTFVTCTNCGHRWKFC